MQTFEQVLEEILKIKTETVPFSTNGITYPAKLRTLTAEQSQEFERLVGLDDIDDVTTYVTNVGMVFEDVRVIDHPDYSKEKLIQFWNYFNDEDLPEEVAKEICSLSGLKFPEKPVIEDYEEESEEPEPLDESDQLGLSPNSAINS